MPEHLDNWGMFNFFIALGYNNRHMSCNKSSDCEAVLTSTHDLCFEQKY